MTKSSRGSYGWCSQQGGRKTRQYEVGFTTANCVIPKGPIDLKSFEWDHHTFNKIQSQGMSLLISRPQCYQNRSVFTQIHDSEYMHNFRTGFKAETTNFLRYHERGQIKTEKGAL